MKTNEATAGSDANATASEVDRLVKDFARAVTGVRHTAVVSSDGLVFATSGGLGWEDTERMSAAVSGLASLTRCLAEICETGWVHHTVVDMEGGYLFLMAVPDGFTLVVLTGPECDIGYVVHEAARLVARVGKLLTPEVRAGLRQMLMA
ncbi:roadblock/LC7 domain-containing protein [Streptomyces sp. H27-D2]|uniref:roadblock/LC7 domain-containing protein n=1 Tax=Streptomyces sp. H27-D2 TaxID=3046304 RepID=UPI002DB8678D|nr:roadblock/LC7 domain-containing protein [Streptomyces sp. H27-D2]MEC4017965.1 roadblock/LC7 domain-containing protein [Streptomyces sp. H27-D2]